MDVSKMTDKEILLMREENDALVEEVKDLKSKLQRMQDKVGLVGSAKIEPSTEQSCDASDSNEEETTTATAITLKKDTALRRLSIEMGEAFFDTAGKLLPGFLKAKEITEFIASNDWAMLGESFIDQIKISSANSRMEIENWFDANFPSWGEEEEGLLNDSKGNVRTFMVELAVKLRPMIKMFRIGLGLRLLIIAVSSYVDMATDVLVTINYFNREGQEGWGQASLGCVSAGIGVQALFAWIQYRQAGFRTWGPMVMSAFMGILPLIEAWTVFRGAEQSEDMLLDPAVMLAITKGAEIVFESLPESIIQTISMLSSKPEDLSTLNYFGIISSIVSAGLIFADAHLGIARSNIVGSPKNPVYNWLPTDKGDFYKCMGGYILFTISYFSCNIFAFAIAYLKFGGSAVLSVIITELIAVLLFKHFVDGELFAISIAKTPSKADYIPGVLIELVYFVAASVGYLTHSKNPAEFGPHVTSALIIWRMATGSTLVIFALPELAKEGFLPWLSVTGGMALYFSCLATSWIGLAIFFRNMAKEHERWRWWRRQTGKQHTEEMWDAKEIWSAGCETKEEDILNWFMNIHPLYFPMDRIKSWICTELVTKYGEEDGKSCPAFHTQAFHDRMVEIFKWWGKKGALDEVNEALTKLPVHVGDPTVESQSSKISTQKSKGVEQRSKGMKKKSQNKVVPASEP
ncbi:hypothetical protein TrCOL_g10514 [Triparma columacea]|uniref:Uncharacterized protein n=1 Tax=Triparma columacea TaxID=722753 RepID=A0A9W7GQZ4_9STRA|nr:hypothetical protein TrCOL_g10514 [Triparma columacea]